MDKILIIHDSRSANVMLKSRLESAGFSIETAETVEEGIQKAKECQCKLVLLDSNLPGISGIFGGECKVDDRLMGLINVEKLFGKGCADGESDR